MPSDSSLQSPLIAAADLYDRLGDTDVVVVDCRFNLMQPTAGRLAWLDSHIPGAVYAHLDDDLARPPAAHEGRHPLPDPEQFTATLGRLGIAPDDLVVAYDDAGGAIAARLWWMLGWIGHRRRALLDGGLRAWQAAEYPVEAGAVQRSVVAYPPVVADSAQVATTDEVRAGVGLLLDARARARFIGAQEPIDPVAGHVPGARNLPFDALLGPDQRFREPAELAGIFADAFGSRIGTNDTDLVAMCGSGVTACHLLAGLAAVGRSGRLYAGSWSEWIRDPDRAVATAD